MSSARSAGMINEFENPFDVNLVDMKGKIYCTLPRFRGYIVFINPV